MSLILKLRLVLKITSSQVSTDIRVSEDILNGIESEKHPIPNALIKYYADHLSVSSIYLRMLFSKNKNYLYKIIIKCINKYFDMILWLRKANEEK